MADSQIITKTFEYRIRPNKKFVAGCERALDDSRFVYNCALEQRIRVYEASGKTISFYEQSRQLTEARHELPEIGSVLRTIQSDALERLDFAFDAFFRRLKNGEKPGFPRFKARDRYHTFSQKFEKQRACPLKGDKLTVPGVGTCRVRVSRPLEGKIKQLRITRRADGWYALLVCDIPRPGALPKTGLSVGVDVGITSFATLSNGEEVENPRHLKQAEDQLTREQRKLARKKKGSQNRKKARQKVALRHLKTHRARKHFHHEEAAKLVNRFDRIAVEDLNIRGMVKNHHLAKAISDVAWGHFFEITKSKAENAGRTFEKVNPRYTSQICSKCGHKQKMPLAIRIYECEQCGLVIG
ncbi:MAG: RNA-guided endonuclease InsQ/TnpB family protein, partial [Blastocatellia bacterium]